MDKFWHEVDLLLRRHGHVGARRNKRVSISTFYLRRHRLLRELRRLRTGALLRADGSCAPAYKLASPYGFARKHLDALLADWQTRHLSVAMVHNLLSTFRLFCVWIEKPGLVPPTAAIITDPQYRHRQQAARRDHSWAGAGLNPASVIARIHAEDTGVGLLLDLMLTFGLRVREASLLRPHLADQKTYLDVSRGSKGRRPRTVPIVNDDERNVLARARAYVTDPLGCLVPPDRTFKSWSNHVYYRLRRHGITRASVGTSAHGLRHERLQDEYHRLTGVLSPVQQGQPGAVDPQKDRLARAQVAALAGHARPSIAAAYLGPARKTGISNHSRRHS